MERILLVLPRKRIPVGSETGQRPFEVLTWMKALAFLIVLFGIGGCGYFIKPRGEVMPVQAKAPEFSLLDQNGKQVSLRKLLSRGPVVIVFYRGHW